MQLSTCHYSVTQGTQLTRATARFSRLPLKCIGLYPKAMARGESLLDHHRINIRSQLDSQRITKTLIRLRSCAASLYLCCLYSIKSGSDLSHRVGGNRKRSLQSTNVDQKSLETAFSIAFCRQSGDKWQSKTLFLSIFDLRSSMVLTFSIAAYRVCLCYRLLSVCLNMYGTILMPNPKP